MAQNTLFPHSKYNRFPFVEISNGHWKVEKGWKNIGDKINAAIQAIEGRKKTIVVECYQGVIIEEIENQFRNAIQPDAFFRSSETYKPESEIIKMVYPDVTNDRIFGYMTRLTMIDFFDPDKLQQAKDEIENRSEGVVLVTGTGAALLCQNPDILIYADMARWEIQLRMRKHLVDNMGVGNRNTSDWMLLYKQGYFVDWRVCDNFKKELFSSWDYLLDTNISESPKLIESGAIFRGLNQTVTRPFSVVPFFDPGPWGGQWMKNVCNLDPTAGNYAWCFNCVPEENSLYLKFGDEIMEVPSINLVFFHPEKLLGKKVYQRFGDEFPIRFDFLDTMGGGNLSLQVHPLPSYILENFGMKYTQDESYYLMDARENAVVYLGLKDGVDDKKMIKELESAQAGATTFEPEKFVQTWSAKKHDHFLIPSGTVHCSGANSMVLEISATPYIFTFKLWDWGRLGLDGKPRPININHGKEVIRWDRTTQWVEKNLVNRVEKIDEGDGWVEERTGLHESEFIETRRHWFTKNVLHETHDNVQVLCLVEGDEIVVESPENQFSPFTVHYAEVFIVPAAVAKFTISPSPGAKHHTFCTVKAYVR